MQENNNENLQPEVNQEELNQASAPAQPTQPMQPVQPVQPMQPTQPVQQVEIKKGNRYLKLSKTGLKWNILLEQKKSYFA